jgi:glucose/arabinose dehydrogenase
MSWIGDALYAVVGEQEVCIPGLYRLADKDSDTKLDTVELLTKLDGSGEHGPHAVIAGADGEGLYVLAGNATALPPLAGSRVPRLWASDTLTPLTAVMGSELKGRPHGSWICRVSRDGRQWELVCMGMRNAYALAVDAEGELFTCDSDTEFEIGTPWYRPNRVLHCVSGADFGWRPGALKTPERAADTLPRVLPMGAGSPTAVLFAKDTAFSERYQKALLVADWSFGRLLAVHLKPEGASFAATSEEIVSGSPLAITAACVNPKDGAVYFVTGGRRTESALYRLSWKR